MSYDRHPPRARAGLRDLPGAVRPAHVSDVGRGSPEPSTYPPALVIGSGITALAVVRSMGRHGVPVHVLSEDAGLPRHSRWSRPPPGGKPLRSPTELEAYLRELPIAHAVLIPAADDGATAISTLPPELRCRFPSSQADPSVLLDVMDKGRLFRVLEDHGVPHPKTVAVRSLEDVRAVDALHMERAFIKPRDSQEFHRRLKVKALRPTDREDLLVQLRRLSSEGLAVVVQEYVPGPPTNHYFVEGFIDRLGRVRARMVRRRLRMWPPEFGNSCATRTVSVAEGAEAVESVEGLLRAVSYRGPYDAEFKLDPRDGVFKLLEINVRPWWQIEFAAHCGVDIVWMVYRDALGLPVAAQMSYELDREWLYAYYDLQACLRMIRDGEGSLSDCLSSWMRARWATFGWDDPKPGFTSAAAIVWRAIRRRARRDK